MAAATLGLVATLAFQLPAPVPRAPVAARRSGAAQLILGLGEVEFETRKTTGDAKAAFNSAYGRPVNGQYQGFVNEILTSVTLAVVQSGYQSSRVFYLGVTSLSDVFLAGMADAEREKLFLALCAGIGMDAKKLRAEAQKLSDGARGLTEDQLFAADDLSALAEATNFKYS